MDEPTSALTSKESEILFSKVNELKQKGIAFIFISHRLEEVFELCDSYTVLRDGKWIASGDIKDVDTDSKKCRTASSILWSSKRKRICISRTYRDDSQ